LQFRGSSVTGWCAGRGPAWPVRKDARIRVSEIEPARKEDIMGEYFDKAKGKAKEVAGKVTGDKGLEAEGVADETKGKIKERYEDLKERTRDKGEELKERARNAAADAKERIHETEDDLRRRAQHHDDDMKKV
jgi:uncharacterized protein YjbJ (UPF0337 family)